MIPDNKTRNIFADSWLGLLQLMHSQATDFEVADISLERGTQLLLAAARDMKPVHNPPEYAYVLSMKADPGIFAPRSGLATFELDDSYNQRLNAAKFRQYCMICFCGCCMFFKLVNLVPWFNAAQTHRAEERLRNSLEHKVDIFI